LNRQMVSSYLPAFEAAISYLQKSIECGGLHAGQCTIMAGALEGLGQPKKALSWVKLACSVDGSESRYASCHQKIRGPSTESHRLAKCARLSIWTGSSPCMS
jgi:hypothetical protein